jgi:hypothetical protein
MFRLRTFVLTALSVTGFSVASAQAGCWIPTTCQTTCQAPVVACTPAPCAVTAGPVVVRPVIYPTYYRARVHCPTRIVHYRHCR